MWSGHVLFLDGAEVESSGLLAGHSEEGEKLLVREWDISTTIRHDELKGWFRRVCVSLLPCWVFVWRFICFLVGFCLVICIDGANRIRGHGRGSAWSSMDFPSFTLYPHCARVSVRRIVET